MSATLRQIGRLVTLLLRDPRGRVGLGVFALILVLEFGMIHISVRLIAWNAAFYDAIQKLDSAAALTQVGVFFVLTGIGAGLFLIGRVLRQRLQMRWRHVLNDIALTHWFNAKAYWHMANTGGETGIDNPDQRIAEDCRLFVNGLTEEAIDLIAKVVAIVSYVSILWSLSDIPLRFTLFDVPVEIPRYLIWLAPVYVLLSSIATHILGGPLKRITMAQQHREADYRFALARLRDVSDPVALMNGEPAERRMLDRRFEGIVENWRAYVRRDFVLGLFTRPYFMTVLNIPLFIALPAFLAGHVTFGGLMQLRSAFSSVTSNLSWFIFQYRDLIAIGAAAGRLDSFLASGGAEPSPRGVIAFAKAPDGSAGGFRVRDLTLVAPDGLPILSVPELELVPGRTVWIQGPSGTGKTTLLKALAGIWRTGGGRIDAPAATCLFLPQQAYMPLGSLADAVAYPADPAAIGEAELASILAAMRIDPMLDPAGLSGGERQRVALARILALRPDWVFMDEATSALDAVAEALLMSELVARLPGTTFVVVSHSAPRGFGDLRIVNLAAASAQEEAVA